MYSEKKNNIYILKKWSHAKASHEIQVFCLRKAEAVKPWKTMYGCRSSLERRTCLCNAWLYGGWPTPAGWRRGAASPLVLSSLSVLAKVANMRATDSQLPCQEDAAYEPLWSWLLTEDIKNLKVRIKGITKPCAAGWRALLKTGVHDQHVWGTADINACKGKAEPRAFLMWQPGTCLA